MKRKILLVKTPFFSPLTPPLGIALLSSFLESNGYEAECYDFNVDPELWGTHHKYFTTLQKLERVTINDGYSKLWYILNAHSLAYMNGSSRETCAHVLRTVMPLYGIESDERITSDLLTIVERFFARLEEMTKEIDTADISVVGTSTYTTSLSSSLFFLRYLKQKQPSLTTVMGGGVFADDLALGSDNLDTLLREYPFVDHVILGEGELLFLKLLNGEFNDKRVISIADVDGKTLPMEEVPTPDFSDFNLENYFHLSIEGARSCPFECSFCSETIQWGLYRKKPKSQLPNQIVSMAEKYNNNTYFMGDSLMNPYIATLSSGLLEHAQPILYDGYLRADKHAASRERTKVWASSGMYRARLGIESASDAVLEMMVKMTTRKTISEVLKSLANAGIRTTTYWIVGFPGETEEHFEETLDFIKEHHRYIYELEAHPYYYYPYGQIGSRLYQCKSLYPDDVTEAIKFQLWDVLDIKPERMERYDRLRRISALASGLGLPNIYTMTERYAAEERWHRLHPLSVEVYEGTMTHRDETPPADLRIAAETDQAALVSSENFVCYHVEVQGGHLDEAVLADAARAMVSYNQVLRVSLQDGHYVANGNGLEGSDFLTVGALEGDEPTVVSRAIEEAVAEVGESLQPTVGESVHVVLLQGKEPMDTGHLLLLAHPTVADARSVVLLLEDLFRLYEQLKNERQPSLLPVTQTYLEYLEEQRVTNGNGDEQKAYGEPMPDRVQGSEAQGPQTGLLDRQVLIGKTMPELHASIGSAQRGDSQLQVLLAAAVVRSVRHSLGTLKLALRRDQRAEAGELNRTAGPLTAVERLTVSAVDPDDPAADLWFLDRSLHGTSVTRRPPASDKPDVLLNLEYLVDEPWMGGDSWQPRGFVVPNGPPRDPYQLEITPLVARDQLRVRVGGLDTPEIRDVIDALSQNLSQELETLRIHALDARATREPSPPGVGLILDHTPAPEAHGPGPGNENLVSSLVEDEFNF